MATDKLIIVSGDGHAEAPPEVGRVRRSRIPRAPVISREDHERFVKVMGLFSDFDDELLAIIDPDGVWAEGRLGALGNVDQRLAQMDREGVAAEMIFQGDPQALRLFAPMWQERPQDFYAAGSRLYNRWVADTFGEHGDRFYLIGDPGLGVDIDMMLEDLQWMAQHDFRGSYLPMTVPRSDLPRLYDTYFDPYWGVLQEHGIWAAAHAGYGEKPLTLAGKVEQGQANLDRGIGFLDRMNNQTGDFFHRAYEPLQALWQMMLGGVFDGFPDLRFMLTELRADWIPSLLVHLDEVYDRSRADLPAKRKPSEYWHTNCLQSISFMHKCEVPMRHEIGIENIVFARDYPHPEGVAQYETVASRRVWRSSGERAADGPRRERDRDAEPRPSRLEAIAQRVGFTVDDILGPGPEIDERMIHTWDLRSGYLKQAQVANPASIDALLAADPVLAAAVH